jgi:group I intron endonuclease
MAQIYIITNKTNNKQYIGVTNNPLDVRWKSHCYDNNAISQAIKKYGKENFTIESLLECSSMDEAYELEPKYIIEHNTKYPNGYNISDGGKGSQIGKRKPTPDHVKQKISESIKKNHYWNNLTEEQKEQFRELWRANNKSRIGQKRSSYNTGLFKKTIWINNGQQRKRVPETEINVWLEKGWARGHMNGLKKELIKTGLPK